MQLSSMQPSPTGFPLRQESDQNSDDVDPLAGEDLAFPDPFALPVPPSAAEDQRLAAGSADLQEQGSSEMKCALAKAMGDAMVPDESVAVAAPGSGMSQHAGVGTLGTSPPGSGAMVTQPPHGKGPEPARSASHQDTPSIISAAQSMAIPSSPSGAPSIGLDAMWQAQFPSLSPPVADAFAGQSSANSEGSTPILFHTASLAVGVEPAGIPAEPLSGAIISAKAVAESSLVTGEQRGRQADGIALVLPDQARPDLAVSDATVAPLAAAAEGRSAPATSFAPHALSGAPHPPPAQIAALIVDQVRSGTPGLIEVSLSPIELGAIRFEMQQGPDGLHVHLAIERPETGDLVRRHVDQLVADLRAAGLGQATLSFGQWTQRQPSDRQAAAVLARGPFALTAAEPVSAQPALSASGRLHLRL